MTVWTERTDIWQVTPGFGREHLTRHLIVGYNGFGKPAISLANPEDLFFITDRHHPPTVSLWMVPGTDGETEDRKNG